LGLKVILDGEERLGCVNGVAALGIFGGKGRMNLPFGL